MEGTGADGIPIPRPNFDTIYSAAVIDLSAGKISITLPNTDRYMSVYCLDQDHYAVQYSTAPSQFHLKKEFIKTDYLICLLRLVKYFISLTTVISGGIVFE